MEKFRVVFKYDKENSTTIFIESVNKQSVFDEIISYKEWYTHQDDKGVLRVINMQRVNEFYIQEYQPAIRTLK